MKRTKQYVLLLLIVVTCLFLPLSCVPVLYIVNSVNPMQWMFITDFTVENQSGQKLSFTPVGTCGKEGRRSRLPIYMSAIPAVGPARRGDFDLAPGETKKILYDWDDINFSEIAVRTGDGMWFQLVVDPNSTERQYHPPATKRFVIPTVGELQPIDACVLAAAERTPKRWRFNLVMTLGLALPFMLKGFVGAYRKEKQNVQPAAQRQGGLDATSPPAPH